MIYIQLFLAFLVFILNVGVAYSDLINKNFSWRTYLISIILFILIAIGPIFLPELPANFKN